MSIDRVRVNENSTKVVTFTILDADGVAVPRASLTGATLTLYDMGTATGTGGSPAVGVINDRDGQDILNTNNVTIHATSGLVTWTMQPDDNIIVTERRQLERHRAMFTFTWATGSFDYEFEVEVLNLRKAS